MCEVYPACCLSIKTRPGRPSHLSNHAHTRQPAGSQLQERKQMCDNCSESQNDGTNDDIG
jgi:hypothetical protein